MSGISAVRMTCGLQSPVIRTEWSLEKPDIITHHVGCAGTCDLSVQKFFSHKHPGTEDPPEHLLLSWADSPVIK